MVKDYIPAKGDIIWLDFNPQSGHEQAGNRPALVISPQAYNHKTSLVIVCPITSQIKKYPFEVLIPPELPIQGVILADQIKSLDRQARKAQFICKVPSLVLEEVVAKLRLLID